MAMIRDDVVSAVTARVGELIAADEATKTTLLDEITTLEKQVDEVDHRIEQSRFLCAALESDFWGTVVRDEVTSLLARTSPDSSVQAAEAPDQEEAAATADTRTELRDGSMTSRVLALMAAQPTRGWTAPLVHQQLPGTKKPDIRNALRRLLAKRLISRPAEGLYFYLRPDAPQGEAEQADVGVTERSATGSELAQALLDVLTNPVGQARALSLLAETVRATVDQTHRVLLDLVRQNVVATDAEGHYLVPLGSDSEFGGHVD